ncbi:MAG TPA: hypothetical protein VH643_23360 [Gemmataceae bacterium]|jgi:hypothetical protein
MTDNTQDRLNAFMARFKRFELDTSDPKWSSYALDRFFEEVTATPGGSLQDVYQGLDAALKAYSVERTPTVANLIKDVVKQGFTQYRSAYNGLDWGWANEALSQGASAARCYLFLLALPPEAATPQSVVTIHRALQGTPYQQEAADTLSDALDKPEVRRLMTAK